MPGNVETRPSVQLPVILPADARLGSTALSKIGLALARKQTSSEMPSTDQMSLFRNPFNGMSQDKRRQIIKKYLPFLRIELEIQNIEISKIENELARLETKLKDINQLRGKLNPKPDDYDTKLKTEELEKQTKKTEATIAALKTTLSGIKEYINEVSKLRCEKEEETLESPLDHPHQSILNDLRTMLHEDVKAPLDKAQKEIAKLPKQLNDHLAVLKIIAPKTIEPAIEALRQSSSSLDTPNPSDS